MAALNEKNTLNAKELHLMLTNKCDRNCRYCCNKTYDVINDVEVVTDEDFEDAEFLYLTGGEPFTYANPNGIAHFVKKIYKNIKRIGVYTNAEPLKRYLENGGSLEYIDTLTISLKCRKDVEAFDYIVKNEKVRNLRDKVWVYYFPKYEINIEDEHFHFVYREWQKDFTPAPNSIFRRVALFPENM